VERSEGCESFLRIRLTRRFGAQYELNHVDRQDQVRPFLDRILLVTELHIAKRHDQLVSPTREGLAGLSGLRKEEEGGTVGC
jgi:hypothetical protein